MIGVGALNTVVGSLARRAFRFPHVVTVLQERSFFEATADRFTVRVDRCDRAGRRRRVATRELDLSWCDGGESEILESMRSVLASIAFELDPPPLPVFRIGLWSPKRLQPRPRKS